MFDIICITVFDKFKLILKYIKLNNFRLNDVMKRDSIKCIKSFILLLLLLQSYHKK